MEGRFSTEKLVNAALMFVGTFVTGMAVYQGFSEITKVGLGDALYQPLVQGCLMALGALGWQARSNGTK